MALQTTRNLLQYFFADSVISNSSHRQHAPASPVRNKISFSTGSQAALSLCDAERAIQICPSGDTEDGGTRVRIIVPNGLPKSYTDRSEGLAAIFLHPRGEALELVVWGSNAKMLAQVARLVPTMTGAGVPDWVVMSESASWRGAEGCAFGFFDARWEITGLSSFTLGSSGIA
jgi:hypothetical protein